MQPRRHAVDLGMRRDVGTPGSLAPELFKRGCSKIEKRRLKT